MGWKSLLTGFFIFVLLSAPGCSLKKVAMKQVADMLTGKGSSAVFSGDDDPELVADALPFAIKMYESLSASAPNHRGLQLTTGSLYVMYANAFLHNPASMLPDEDLKQKESLLMRAKKLYLRGRDRLIKFLDLCYPGLSAVLSGGHFAKALDRVTLQDAPLLYWAGAGWMGAFAVDPFDMKLALSMPGAAALMERVRHLDPRFESGAIDSFYILYYGSMPAHMGGDFDKARSFFQRALQSADAGATGHLMALATTVSIKLQDAAEFSRLLKAVLAVDPDMFPLRKLELTLNRRKAKWLLEHIEDFFLSVPATEKVQSVSN